MTLLTDASDNRTFTLSAGGHQEPLNSTFSGVPAGAVTPPPAQYDLVPDFMAVRKFIAGMYGNAEAIVELQTFDDLAARRIKNVELFGLDPLHHAIRGRLGTFGRQISDLQQRGAAVLIMITDGAKIPPGASPGGVAVRLPGTWCFSEPSAPALVTEMPVSYTRADLQAIFSVAPNDNQALPVEADAENLMASDALADVAADTAPGTEVVKAPNPSADLDFRPVVTHDISPRSASQTASNQGIPVVATPTRPAGQEARVSNDDRLTAALSYAARGWPVFPVHAPDSAGICSCSRPECRNLGKHPRTMNGHKDATADEETIRNWWAAWPMANIGIVTGAASGLVVIDVDVDKGGTDSLAALIAANGALPATLEVNTGGGGKHYYFQAPATTIRNSAGKLGPGLDVRGDGGYIIAPPSQHRSGKHYNWADQGVSDRAPIAEIPPWLLDLLVADDRTTATRVEHSDRIGAGRRNDAMYRVAVSIARQTSDPSAVAEALQSLNTRLCQPPLDEAEVLAIVASATKANGNGRKNIPASPSGTADVVKLNPLTARELMAMTFPEPRQAIHGLVPEGLTILAGKPKVGKSWLAMQIALAISTGSSTLASQAAAPGEVLYISLEDNLRRLQTRLVQLLDDEAPFQFFLTTELPRADIGGVQALEAWLTEHPDCKCVIIDTLARFKPRSSGRISAYDEDAAVGAQLQGLALRFGVALIIIHHLRKLEASDPVDAISGSLGLPGAADAILVLQRRRGQDEAALHVTGRDIDERELNLEFDRNECIWNVTSPAPARAMSNERQAVLDMLRQDSAPLGPKEISVRLGKNYGATRKLLFDMKQAGLLQTAARGQYTLIDGEHTGNIGNFGGETQL